MRKTDSEPVQCALLIYLADRDRFARANDPAAVGNRTDCKSAVLFSYSDGQIPGVANLLAGHDRVADDIGGSAAKVLFRFLAITPSPTLEVAIGPVQEIIQLYLNLLGQLPLPEQNESASVLCIAAGLLTTRNPKTGVQNVSIHCCQINGDSRIDVLLLRDTRSPPIAARRFGQTGVEWPQRHLAETAPLSGRNCPVRRRIVEDKGERLYGR